MNMLTEWLTREVLGSFIIVVKHAISAVSTKETEAEGTVLLAVAAEMVGMGVVVLGMLQGKCSCFN